MKLPKLSDVLEHMRQEIQRKKDAISVLAKPHRFPCPYCQAEVSVNYKPDGVSYTLRHGPSACVAYAEPTQRTRTDLLEAFVFHCRPTLRYGAVEGLETKGEK